MEEFNMRLNGITTTSVYQEGDCLSLVNLRPKNGMLEPVVPRKKVKELAKEFYLIFAHHINSMENWIGVTEEDGESKIYSDAKGDDPVYVGSVKGKVNSIQQIGFTLSVITDEIIHYLLLYNGEYVNLGELPDIPVIGVKTADHTYSREKKFKDEYGSNDYVNSDNMVEATKGLVNVIMDEMVNGYIDKDGNALDGEGLILFDAHFIRYAFRLFDGSYVKHSAPILVMPHKNILEMKQLYAGGIYQDSGVSVNGYRVQIKYDLTHLEEWSDIIKSVDIFLSQPLGLSNIENVRKDLASIEIKDNVYPVYHNLINRVTSTMKEVVEQTANFYLLQTLDAGDKKGWEKNIELPSKDITLESMDNLIFQEELPDDSFSHHKYGAAASHAFNGRVLLGNLKTTFFNGYNPEMFLWQNFDNGLGYNGNTLDSATGEIWNQIVLEVTLNTGQHLSHTFRILDNEELKNQYKLFMSGMISYPDSRAISMTIWLSDGDIYYKSAQFNLKSHKFLNLAYYLDENFNPILFNGKEINNTPDVGKDLIISEPNKVKVSEQNNPISFPNSNTYLTGNGKVLALATNATYISEGQFGQYPLYIFTSQGIYSLEVGSDEVAYSTMSAPTSYEVPISPVVTPTSEGIAFISKRGVCLIRGQEIRLLTSQIKESAQTVNFERNHITEKVIHEIENISYSQFLKGLDNLLYDPHEDELIMCCASSSFNYVYNFETGSLYQITEKIDFVVGNTMPDIWIIDGKTLKYFPEDETNENGDIEKAQVSFVTRPLKYGTQNIKECKNIIMYAPIKGMERYGYTLQASEDHHNFWIEARNYKEDVEIATGVTTGRMALCKARSFLWAFGATFDKDTRIDHLYSLIVDDRKL